tara:strand:+ start:372 stop:545 length:174 start_codon:yes stop_codon:yes gene_type:complete
MDKLLSNIKGKLPKKLSRNQNRTTIRNPSLIFIFELKLFFILGKNKRLPIAKIMIKE